MGFSIALPNWSLNPDLPEWGAMWDSNVLVRVTQDSSRETVNGNGDARLTARSALKPFPRIRVLSVQHSLTVRLPNTFQITAEKFDQTWKPAL